MGSGLVGQDARAWLGAAEAAVRPNDRRPDPDRGSGAVAPLSESGSGTREPCEGVRNRSGQSRRGADADHRGGVEGNSGSWRTLAEEVLDTDQQKQVVVVLDAMEQIWRAGNNREWASFLSATFRLAHSIGAFDPLPEPVRRYVPLVTALASAKTADQVRGALEKSAAPVGSYVHKREPGHHISVSAIVGPAAGFEHAADKTTDHYALFAPVGLDVVWAAATRVAGSCR